MQVIYSALCLPEPKATFPESMCLLHATYGSESWAMTKNDRKRVDAFEMWCYRRLLRVSWKDKRTNDWVLSKVGCELMLRKTIDSRKLRYFGHISRKDGSIEKVIMQGTVEGSRGRGRPSTSWTDDIKRNSETKSYSSNTASSKQNWLEISCNGHSSTCGCHLTLERERDASLTCNSTRPQHSLQSSYNQSTFPPKCTTFNSEQKS